MTQVRLSCVQGGNQGVMVLGDGTMRGDDAFFYAYGIGTAANG
jgi:hypothetical protein